MKIMGDGRYGKPVHIWTDREIRDLPTTGSWFYGLVKQEDGSIVLCEIHPSLGRSDFSISRGLDGDSSGEDEIKEVLADIGADIQYWNPESLEAEYPDAELQDWEKEIKDVLEMGVTFECIEDLKWHLESARKEFF